MHNYVRCWCLCVKKDSGIGLNEVMMLNLLIEIKYGAVFEEITPAYCIS